MTFETVPIKKRFFTFRFFQPAPNLRRAASRRVAQTDARSSFSAASISRGASGKLGHRDDATRASSHAWSRFTTRRHRITR
jgi:hypothetical protein